MNERVDVVVVGGGIAGLTAAWRLRHRCVLLLEADDRLGGRLRSQRRGDYWLNLGAHLFPGPGSTVDGLVRELGLETSLITGTTMGLALGDRVLNSGRAESYVLRLPLSMPERLTFARAGLRLRRAVARRRRMATAAPGETAERARERTLAFLGNETFAEFLGELPPRVASIFACAAHRATAEPDVLSAGCGAGLFALVWGGKSSLIARNLIGGSSRLPEAIGEALGDRVRLRARGLAMTEDDDGVRVDYELDGAPAQVHAGQVIVAAPAPHAAPLLASIAPEAAAALASLTYGPFVSMAIETNESEPMPWDGTYAIATPGRSFDLFTNQAHVLRDGSPRRRGGSLMVFAGGRSAERMLEQPDEAISRTFLNDLHSLYPATRGVVADTVVGRWPLGNVFATPGRHVLQPALEGPLGRNGRVHLAGDYFAELGTMETAAATGTAAAKRADTALTQASGRPAHSARPVSSGRPAHPDRPVSAGTVAGVVVPLTAAVVAAPLRVDVAGRQGMPPARRPV